MCSAVAQKGCLQPAYTQECHTQPELIAQASSGLHAVCWQCFVYLVAELLDMAWVDQP